MMKRLSAFCCLVGLAIASPANALVTIDSTIAGQVFMDDVDLVTGGQVNGDLGLNGFDLTVNILDGVITGNLGILNGEGHTINVLGGSIGNDITLNGIDHVVNIEGGSFGGEFFTNGFTTTVNIFGYGLSVSGDFDIVGATVSGFLADGTAINSLFRSNGSEHTLNLINVSVPEPGMLSLLGFGVLALLVVARRRRRPT